MNDNSLITFILSIDVYLNAIIAILSISMSFLPYSYKKKTGILLTIKEKDLLVTIKGKDLDLLVKTILETYEKVGESTAQKEAIISETPQNVQIKGDNIFPYLITPTIDNEYSKTKNKSLLRYPNLECPNTSVINERFSVFVQISIKAKHPGQQPIEIQDDPDIPDRLPEIDIVLIAYNFDIEGDRVRTVKIDRDNDIEERFVLIPRQSGEQEIRVEFYQNRRPIGTLKHDIHISIYQSS